MKLYLKIRPAIARDSSFVYPLAKAMATSFEVVKDSFDLSFEEILSDPAAICIVAEKEEEIVGYLIGFDHRAFYANGRVSWVEEVYVLEDLRNQGIGKRLMKEFETWCIERDSKLVALATRRASRFYEAIGYEDSATFYKKTLNHNKSMVDNSVRASLYATS